MKYIILEKARPHKYIKREGSKSKWIYTYPEQKKSESEIRNSLRSGNVSDLVATIIYRAVGSNEALVDINGNKFLLDHQERLKLSGVPTDYSKRKSQYPNKTEGEVNEWLKRFPKLGQKDFGKETEIVKVGNYNFIQPERAKKLGSRAVLVDVDKFDKEWSKDEDFYIGPGGTGAKISDRYERFNEFLKTGELIEMPEVSSRPLTLGTGSLVGFTNGRHRFAVLRDLGFKVIPLSVDLNSFAFFKENFSLGKQKPSPKSTIEAYNMGKLLTREDAIEVWETYKRGISEPYPDLSTREALQAFELRAFNHQMMREMIEGYLGKDIKETSSWEPKEIDERLYGVKKSFVVLEKAEVQPFSRIRLGKVENVRRYSLPERYKADYSNDAKGVMDFIKDHVSIEGYGRIVSNASKESKYVMEAVNTAFLDVTNRARGTLERMARTDMPRLKSFLMVLFEHVQDDALAFRKDLRKSEVKPFYRKKRGKAEFVGGHSRAAGGFYVGQKVKIWKGEGEGKSGTIVGTDGYNAYVKHGDGTVTRGVPHYRLVSLEQGLTL
ncbi:hypothetical protein A2Z67_02870 [Candidatus Woesebacteria bacterium RBG_13_36_22]|uniref:Uncharacterized protein n=1 Tax=Candidatus Woesebacteria bacterium RBG_13_36_22 TaxID=1802478 RepID=A0A1F7X604_9BACT|nr:MAG: hypothetical protein A2Z67_02870 [Candidatus Woesebacteria bacterium RBG_13_36_22]